MHFIRKEKCRCLIGCITGFLKVEQIEKLYVENIRTHDKRYMYEIFSSIHILGAAPIATLNLQHCGEGCDIPDAWHHQMIFGVGQAGIYLTNPLECLPEQVRTIDTNQVNLLRFNCCILLH